MDRQSKWEEEKYEKLTPGWEVGVGRWGLGGDPGRWGWEVTVGDWDWEVGLGPGSGRWEND